MARPPFESNPMTNASQTTTTADHPLNLPDIQISVRQTFGLDDDLMVPAFSKAGDHVPDRDDS